jgi:transposase
MRAYVGADWSATEVVCALAAEGGPPLPSRLRAAPRLEAVRELIDQVRSKVGATEVVVLLEAGAEIWLNLFHAAGAAVHVADPKQARRFAESQTSSGAKDDPRDAASLLDMCRSEAHRKHAWAPEPAEIRQLDVLATLQEQRSRDLGRAKQRLRQVLRGQMPLVEEALPKDIGAQWVARLLRQAPTPWHARKLTRSEFDRLTEGGREQSRVQVWEALQATQAPWLDAAVAKTIGAQVRFELAQMELMGKQLAEIEAQLEEATSGSESRKVAQSIKGIGLQLSSTLLQYAFREGLPRDRDEASVRVGASPVFAGSGKHKNGRSKGIVRMRRAAPARGRRAAFLIGRLVVPRHPWAAAMYADGRRRGQNAGTVYRRITRCVLRIVTALMRSGEPYDEARYVASLKAKGVSWAAEL